MLLAPSVKGYRSLMRLILARFSRHAAERAAASQTRWLEGEPSDLIALTGGPGGPLDVAVAAGQSHLAAARCDALLKLFGDRLYIELQRHGTPAERRAEAG